MFSLIRYELTGETPAIPSFNTLDSLYTLSKKHDLAHMVGDALKKNSVGMTEELSQKFDKEIMTALFRYEQSRFELERIKLLFEAEKIPFVPLKGSVIRELYPEPWMRTSCDIDILIHESDLAKAIKALSEKLGYKVGNRFPHDVSLMSEGGVHLELHFDLIEDDFLALPAEILKSAWEYATPKTGLYEHTFSNEFFLFYHIAHMAKHFLVGGCGIRPFIDLILIKRSESFSDTSTELIKKSGLMSFFQAALKLSELWFSDGVIHDGVTLSMEKYLLCSGVYGSTENRVAVGKTKSGGKLSYVISRIFLPYGIMKKQHPILKKCPLLLPFFHITRWFRIIFGGRLKKGMTEISLSAKSTENEEISELMKKLEI